MKRTEITFLICVLAFALIFAGMSLSHTAELLALRGATERPLGAVAGQPRTLDVDTVKRLIRERRLSDREAEFYKKVPPPETPNVPVSELP